MPRPAAGRAAAGPDAQQLFDTRQALTVSALMSEVRRAVATAFPAGSALWVRGELHSVTDHRSGHCYMELVDPELAGDREAPVLKVNCWRSTWGPVKQTLAASGITLQQGMVVTLRGRVDLYAPRGQVNFVALELDVDALLGRLAAQRADLLRRLAAEGLLRRNAALAMPEVPLRVGLIAAAGSEGYRDFVGQLTGSGFAFRVRHIPVPVQGPSAPRAVAGALRALATAGCDVLVLVRGGGTRADLAAFDAEIVARAVATTPVPVLTGIGHTGDRSVADEVAHRAFVTPTECGQALARRVALWWDDRCGSAAAVARLARSRVDEASRHDAVVRARLVACTRTQLHRHGDAVRARAARLAAGSERRVLAEQRELSARAGRLGPMAGAAVVRQHQRIDTWRRLISAYDVERQLRRGYTLTTDGAGRLLRGASGVRPGDDLVTRFADGTVRSTAGDVTPGAGTEG